LLVGVTESRACLARSAESSLQVLVDGTDVVTSLVGDTKEERVVCLDKLRVGKCSWSVDRGKWGGIAERLGFDNLPYEALLATLPIQTVSAGHYPRCAGLTLGIAGREPWPPSCPVAQRDGRYGLDAPGRNGAHGT